MSCIASYPLLGTSNEMCDGNTGGLKTVWGALKSDVVATVTDKDGVKVVTVAAASTEKAAPFVEYQFRKNMASMTSTENIDVENATQYVSTELAMTFKRMDSAKRMSMMALLQNDVVFVVEDMNGTKWFLGFDDAVVASAATGETGTQKSDSNQYTITLTDESKELPYEVDGFDGSLVG